ncbi:MAG: hypothetical protein HYW47_04040 [Deltaproteobacteria bacterium]|nr:hypothetical protein [Deltaproteobacteria bacterium]
MKNSSQGQVVPFFLVLMVPFIVFIFFIFECCEIYSYHIRTQKVSDEVLKRCGEIQKKGLQFLAITNQTLVTLHAFLRTLQALSLLGGVSKVASLHVEEMLKAAIKSLAKLQDRSLNPILYSSLIPFFKMKIEFPQMWFYLSPIEPHYHIERSYILELPGPYRLKEDFFEKQYLKIKALFLYRGIFLKRFLNQGSLLIHKEGELRFEGESLLSRQWKTKFVK